MKLRFPNNFLLGFSESGFQFEMGLDQSEDQNSDWWHWVHDEENIFSGLVSGDMPEQGPGYWSLYKRDHDIASGLGMNCARLGIEWSRIFPKPTFEVKVDVEMSGDNLVNVIVDKEALRKLDALANKDAVEHYEKIFNDWKAREKTLILNLYHWTMPIWIHDPIKMRKAGIERAPSGWIDQRTVIEFVKFAAYVTWRFDDYVDLWSILNEPNVVYGSGFVQVKSGFPPSHLDLQLAIAAAKHIAEAHARAFDNMKSITKKSIGIIQAMFAIEPKKRDVPDHEDAAKKAKKVEIFDFLDLLSKGESMFIGTREDLANRIDWIGVNYYSRVVVEPSTGGMGFKELEGYGLHCTPNSLSKAGRECSDFGWEIYPEGIKSVLIDTWERYRKPIIVTENGIADAKDRYRPRYLVSHIQNVQKAFDEGIDIRGYLHWALVDNYEWAQGFKMRFGLCYVDYETKKRYLRPSALIFKGITEYNELPGEIQEYQELLSL
ncbi:MAG TPA: beta-galactosidase BgaS [Geobacterales bacterium]|nr:beta-galactosidase BgaS [Geobacterales bacterium]